MIAKKNSRNNKNSNLLIEQEMNAQFKTMQISKEPSSSSFLYNKRRCVALPPPMPPRRTKSMPSHLATDEYSGKPLFWFRRRTPYHVLPAPDNSPTRQSLRAEESSSRPRPLIRRLLRNNKSRKSARPPQHPYLMPDARNDSFETATTVVTESSSDDLSYNDYFYDHHDETLVDYSDDEEEEDEETLRGLDFLEEERE